MFEILTNIYYILIIFPLTYELLNIVQPARVIGMKVLFESYNKTTIEPIGSPVRAIVAKHIRRVIFYFVWSFIGLFTVNYVNFILLFITNALSNRFLKKSKTDINQQLIVIRMDALVSFILLLFIAFRHYVHI